MRNCSAVISALGSIVAACIVTLGACHVADIFEPTLVRLDNVVFNMRHIVEIASTSTGCVVVMANNDGMVVDGQQVFSSHSLDWAACVSLYRALDNHTLDGIGRVTRGEVVFSALAQSAFVTATDTCPDDMGSPIWANFPDGSHMWVCNSSVAFARRFAEGRPWPESWKIAGLVMAIQGDYCPEGFTFHSNQGYLRWCCFGNPTSAPPHAGHSGS